MAKAEISAQGVFDMISLFDKKTVQKVKDVVEALDPDMIKRIMQAITVDKEGWVTVKIKLGIQK